MLITSLISDFRYCSVRRSLPHARNSRYYLLCAEGLPNGQVPILEVDSFQLPQSMAILRYVGKLGGEDLGRVWMRITAVSTSSTLMREFGFKGFQSPEYWRVFRSFVFRPPVELYFATAPCSRCGIEPAGCLRCSLHRRLFFFAVKLLLYPALPLALNNAATMFSSPANLQE